MVVSNYATINEVSFKVVKIKKMTKIIFCYTVPITFHFLKDTISLMKKEGFEVVLISSEKQQLMELADSLDVKYKTLRLSRNFSFLTDLVSLFELVFILRGLKADIVVGATPKAALISMIASRIVGVKHRVYHVFGLPYETAIGVKRKVLLMVEKITSKCATDIVPNSNSLSEVYVDKFPIVKHKMRNIGQLTVGGVDTTKFNSDRFFLEIESIKSVLGIPKDSLVIGFVARLTVDKGVGDFIAMWETIKTKKENVVVLVIGGRDSRDCFDSNLLEKFFNDDRVFHIEFTNEVERFMSIMDVFVLPSYREGFGNVNVEASSMKIPVVSYNVTGCKDSVKNGYSGILVEKNNLMALISAVSYFLDSPHEREKYGKQGRDLVKKYFTRQKVAEKFYKFCSNL